LLRFAHWFGLVRFALVGWLVGLAVGLLINCCPALVARLVAVARGVARLHHQQSKSISEMDCENQHTGFDRFVHFLDKLYGNYTAITRIDEILG
jgi:hypothetical protein